MRSYRPSNAISGGGLILLLILAVISGAVVGAILWGVDSYLHLYLVIAFPILGGAIAGGVLARAVKSAKIRNPLMAGVMGVLAGLIMYGVYHFASYYVTFRNEVRSIYEENNGGAAPTDAELDDFINAGLQSEVGDTGFVGYLKFAAQTGFSITRTSASSSESGIEIKDTGAFIYWGIEILIAALVAAAMARNAAKDPFDENANEWYGKPEVFALATIKSRKSLLQALKDGSFQEAGSLMTKQDMKYPRIEIWTRRSPDTAAQDILLVVNNVQRKGRATALKSGVVSSADLEVLNRGIAQASTSNPVVSKS